MRKIIFFLIAITMTVAANAQFSTHTQVIDFYLRFSQYNSSYTLYGDSSAVPDFISQTDEVQTTDISINPSFGFFVKENLLLSAGPLFNYNKRKVTGNRYYHTQPTYGMTQNDINTNYGGSISLTKYLTLSTKLFWYYRVQVSYTQGKGKIEASNSFNDYIISDSETEKMNASGGIGLSFLLSKNFLVNGGIAGLGWTGTKTKRYKANSSDLESELTDSNFGISGLSVSLGLSFILNKD